ncbi:MAG: T9SS type A sorting domain-containing protein [Bacteroidales bacterium]|nr:T9SS type A sorting domain-containing protein [Bacteroidales bacterium]
MDIHHLLLKIYFRKILFFTSLLMLVYLFCDKTYSQSSPSSEALFFSTFLGGGSAELFVTSIDHLGFVMHPNGDIYICGPTESNNFPVTPGAYQPNYAGGTSESFVARLDPTLSYLIASTYIGGSGADLASSLVINKNGNICIAGHTSSDDFPVTSGAFDTTYNTGTNNQSDIFISILSPDLDELIVSTYLGGSLPEGYNHTRITIDTNSNIIVTGATLSGDFPVTPNAYSTTGGLDNANDVFISKLSEDLSQLLSSTYFGGCAWDQVIDLIINHDNNICICGSTGSPDFHATPDAYDPTFNGECDAYISIFGNDLDTLLASTFIGGDDFDNAFSIDLDSTGNFYVCGDTESYNFPYTPGAFDTSFNFGIYDGYAGLIDFKLGTLMACTFIGSSEWDDCRDILYDAYSGDVFITGMTSKKDFPTTVHSFDTTFNGETDAYISRMSDDLSKLTASTFLGGYYYDVGLELIFSEDDNIIVAGNVSSNDFPTTTGAYDESLNGNYDAFIAIMDKDLSFQPVGIYPSIDTHNESGLVLFQNSPNPFSHSTYISFHLPESSHVNIDIYGIYGKKIISLADNTFNAGQHVILWDGKNHSGKEVSKGMFVVNLTVREEVRSKKMIIY